MCTFGGQGTLWRGTSTICCWGNWSHVQGRCPHHTHTHHTYPFLEYQLRGHTSYSHTDHVSMWKDNNDILKYNVQITLRLQGKSELCILEIRRGKNKKAKKLIFQAVIREDVE